MYDLMHALDNAISIVFYITNKCNLKCWHCYNNSSYASRKTNEDYIAKIVEILSKTKCKSFSISGGEPTVEHEILDLVASRLNTTGKSLALMTNGICLPEISKETLSHFDCIQLSIDCPDKEYGTIYKGDEKYGEKEIRAINYLNVNRIPYVITHVPNSGNYNISSYFDKLKIESSTFKIQLPFEKGRAKSNHQYFISELQLSIYLDALRLISRKYPNLRMSFYIPQNDLDGHFSVNYKGDVFTGLFDRIYVGNVLT